MANYIVGDIQGCYSGLRRLLDKADFDPKYDKLWAAGDLVARGPESLETLLYLKSLGPSFETVLGNHDLHFLAIYSGLKAAKRSDKLHALLSYKKVDKLADWLRTKPLAIRIDKQTLLSHAGLYPQWSLKQAVKLSGEVSQVLTSKNWQSFITQMYGSLPNSWHEELQGYDRLRFITNAFTRMRYIKSNHILEFATKSAPNEYNKDIQPWFKINNPKLKPKKRILFGHWATLMGQTQSKQFIGLDTGYVWGNTMTLYCLEMNKRIEVQNKGS